MLDLLYGAVAHTGFRRDDFSGNTNNQSPTSESLMIMITMG